MLEIINKLPKKKLEDIDNFLSFLGIYDDQRRQEALFRLLLSNQNLIKGKVGVEAGAGLGNLTQFLLGLGSKKIFAVEENAACAKYLRWKFKKNKKVEVIQARIEEFHPPAGKRIDFLFQELYGPLLLDESLLSLERINFSPEVVIPDSGVILAETVQLKDFHDPTVNKKILRLLTGTLVTDLFPQFKFRRPFILARWRFSRKAKENYSLPAELKGKGDILVLGMEAWYKQKRVIGTQDGYNWPYVFTPVNGKKFRLGFSYGQGITQVDFGWFGH